MTNNKPADYNSWSASAKQAYDSLLERVHTAEAKHNQQHVDIETLSGFDDISSDLSKRLRHLVYDANQTLDPTHIYVAILQIICEHLGVTSAYILDWNQTHKTTTVLADYIVPTAPAKEHETDLGMTYYLDESFELQVQQTPAYWIVDARTNDKSYIDILRYQEFNVQSSLFVPMYANHEMIGFIEVWDTQTQREYTTEQCLFVRQIADEISNSVHLAQLHRALAQSENRYRLLMDSMQSGVIQTSMYDEIQYINPYGIDLLNLAEGESVIEHAFSSVWEATVVRTATKNEYKTVNTSDPKWLSMTSAIIKSESQVPTGKVYIITDITQRKLAEQRAIAAGIEKERMNLLHQFVQAASHEFFTPLSIINTKVYLLSRHLDEADPLVEELLTSIKDQSTIITDLVNALVEIVRLDSISKTSLHFADLRRVVEDAVTICAPHAQMKNQEIHQQMPLQLSRYLCDSTLLVNVFIKILQNAIQYTPQAGSITVNLDTTADHIVVEIQDTGIGMSEEVQAQIFDRFYRQDKARSERGFGLGLSYAKRVVELHDGTINVMSEVGSGTTMQVLLPISLSEDHVSTLKNSKVDAPSRHPLI